MEYNILEKKGNLLKTAITSDESEKRDFFNKAFNENVNKINIPGFRRGKAPYSVFRNYYGIDRLKEDALEIFINEAYRWILSSLNLNPVFDPEVNVLSFSEDEKEAKLEFLIFENLMISKENLSNIELQYKEKDRKALTLKKIEEIRENFAELKEKEEEAIEEGDIVTVEDLNNTSSRPILIEIGKNFYPEIENKVKGLKRGDKFDLEEKKDDEVLIKSFKVSSIKTKLLPQIDEDFLKNFGDRFETIEKFKEAIQEIVMEEINQEKNKELLSLALAKIFEKEDIKIPESLLTQEAKEKEEKIKESLLTNGISFEDYISNKKITYEDFYKELESLASNELKKEIIIKSVIISNSISILPDEIDEELKHIKNGSHFTNEEKSFFESDKGKRYIVNVLLEKKAIDFIVKNIKVVN